MLTGDDIRQQHNFRGQIINKRAHQKCRILTCLRREYRPSLFPILTEQCRYCPITAALLSIAVSATKSQMLISRRYAFFPLYTLHTVAYVLVNGLPGFIHGPAPTGRRSDVQICSHAHPSHIVIYARGLTPCRL